MSEQSPLVSVDRRAKMKTSDWALTAVDALRPYFSDADRDDVIAKLNEDRGRPQVVRIPVTRKRKDGSAAVDATQQ